jgi:hypothetical protein
MEEKIGREDDVEGVCSYWMGLRKYEILGCE